VTSDSDGYLGADERSGNVGVSEMDRKFRWGLIALSLGALTAILLTGYHFATQASRELKYVEQGEASWYAPGFQGKKTASGEPYNPNELTAAHRKLPLGSKATVTNLDNGKKVQVEITDRGPYAEGRTIDLSKAAAKKLDMLGDGTAPVRIEATERQLEGKKESGSRSKTPSDD
jgi:rare lipoprotein A (peptidoglycan hydrolase)